MDCHTVAKVPSPATHIAGRHAPHHTPVVGPIGIAVEGEERIVGAHDDALLVVTDGN